MAKAPSVGGSAPQEPGLAASAEMRAVAGSAEEGVPRNAAIVSPAAVSPKPSASTRGSSSRNCATSPEASNAGTAQDPPARQYPSPSTSGPSSQPTSISST